jgi:DNA-binding response OmpR family regulator
MPITILLVEDEPGIRSVTAKWLAHHGYAVDEAENGKEGWECIQQRAPDLVITDIAMPEMDGVELCRLIKTTESTADIPVLMFTSHAEADLQLAGTKAGADAYIPKNGDLRVLNARIEALAAVPRPAGNRADAPAHPEPERYHPRAPHQQQRDRHPRHCLRG